MSRNESLRRPLALLAPSVALGALAAMASAQSPASARLYDYAGLSGEHMGSAVAELGDLDGDARADYAIASETAANGRGKVRVVSGSRGTLLYEVDGLAAGERFGRAIARLCDLDGDGVADFVVGAPLANGATLGCGRATVVSGANGATIFAREGSGANDHLGWAVASLGDLDGDGLDEVAAGAIDDDNYGSSSGSVRVWSGASGAQLFEVFGSSANQLFGSSIVSVGDWNGDGTPEFAVGAPSIAGSADTGRVRVFSGANHALVATLLGQAAGENFGAALAVVGDVDGDGRAELAVGAPQVSPSNTGRVDLFLAAGGAALWHAYGSANGDRFGVALAAAGDVDGDGLGDVIAGAPGTDLVGATDTGALVFLSGANGGVIVDYFGVDLGRALGASVAGSGDVNEDGVPDFVAGSPGNLAAPLEAGGALVLSVQPLPLCASDFVVPIAAPLATDLSIDMGAAYAGHAYRMLGSISGLSPKTPWGGVMVPLVIDRYLRHTLGSNSNALLSAPIGLLDGAGRAQVQFTPTGPLATPAYLGITLYHAALILDPQGNPVACSNPVPVTLVP